MFRSFFEKISDTFWLGKLNALLNSYFWRFLPMRFKLCFFFLAILIAPLLSNAQVTEIYGKVIDAATKEPMGYVNVRVYGGVARMTTTDPKGEYQIRMTEKVDSITFSYLGYNTRTVKVKRGVKQELNVEMGSSDLSLTEVTIKAGKRKKHVVDTTANYVYYNIVQNRDRNRENNINTYRYDSYDKVLISLLNPGPKFLNFSLFRPFSFVFKNKDTTDAGNVFIPGVMRETISQVYYRKNPRKTKRFVSADVVSGLDNPSVANMISYQFKETDIYDKTILIANTYFPTPFVGGAIATYYYFLTDTQKIDGRVSYKLHFVGKVKEDLALKGYAWIDSATWAIRSVYFKPNEKANLNFVNDHTVKQDFVLLNDSAWMLSREELQSCGSLFKNKNKLALYITKLYNRKNFVTGIEFPDSIFRGSDETKMSDSARDRTRAYWEQERFEPLKQQHQRVYELSDTMRHVPAWQAYQWLGTFFTSAYALAGPISIGRVLNFVSRNNVEGWRLRFGFETNSAFKYFGRQNKDNFLRQFYFTGYVAYGLKDRDLKYLALMRINLPRKNDRWQSMEAMYRYDMVVPGQDPSQTLVTFDNIASLISGRVLSKIMKVGEFRFSYEKEIVRGFSLMGVFSERVYFDIPGVFDFSRKIGDRSVHIPKFNISEFTIDTRYSYNDLYLTGVFYRYFQNSKYPVFMLRYSYGMVNMQQDHFDYHNLHLTIKQKMQTRAGYTQYLFRAGKIFGKVPYTAAYLTQGNLGILLDKFNYNLLREFEFASDQYVSLWVEHHFNGFFFNKIPGFNKLKLRELLVMRSLFGSFSNKNASVLTPLPELSSPFPIPYIEAGFGIENIGYLLRIDFLWRLTYRDKKGVPTWGVKLAIQPSF